TVKLVPASLNLGAATVGGTSPTGQKTTLTNTGVGRLNIASISASTQFAQTNDCGSSVAPGMSCTITVTLKPTTSGTINGTLSISDDSTDSPQQVSLSGFGFVPCRVQIKKTLSSPVVRSALM